MILLCIVLLLLRHCSNPHFHVWCWDFLPPLYKCVFLDVYKSATQDCSRQILGFQTLKCREEWFSFLPVLTKVDVIMCKPHQWNAVSKQIFKEHFSRLSQFIYLALTQMTSV